MEIHNKELSVIWWNDLNVSVSNDSYICFFNFRKEELEEKDRLQAQIQLDKNETQQKEREKLELRVSWLMTSTKAVKANVILLIWTVFLPSDIMFTKYLNNFGSDLYKQMFASHYQETNFCSCK